MSVEIAGMRKEFTVFVVEDEVSELQHLAEVVKTNGFTDARIFPTHDSALAASRLRPSHLLLLSYTYGSQAVAEEFLKQVHEISREVHVILMADPGLSVAATGLIETGLAYDYITRPWASSFELRQKLDRAALALYVKFENEQLHTYIEQTSGRLVGAKPLPVVQLPASDRFGFSRLTELIASLSNTNENDKAIQHYIDFQSQTVFSAPVLYLRFLPMYRSLQISHATGLATEKFRGLGIDLSRHDQSQLQVLLRHPELIERLGEMATEVFNCLQWTAFAHTIDSRVEGVFFALAKLPEGFNSQGLRLLEQIFELTWKKNIALKEKHAIEQRDRLTGLTTRRRFLEKIEEEVSRARRIRLPLGLIKASIDGYADLVRKTGPAQVDSILRALAVLFQKSVRVTDLVARTDVAEFSILLPHADQFGASGKAERLRRTIEAMHFPILDDSPVRVSFGVAEYPRHSLDGTSLVRAADESLEQALRDGGNRVCLATAPPGQKVDFIVQEPRGEK